MNFVSLHAVDDSFLKHILLVDCTWDTWGLWSSCSETCGPGKQIRTRNYTALALYGGLECEGGSIEYQNCTSIPDCPGM